MDKVDPMLKYEDLKKTKTKRNKRPYLHDKGSSDLVRKPAICITKGSGCGCEKQRYKRVSEYSKKLVAWRGWNLKSWLKAIFMDWSGEERCF